MEFQNRQKNFSQSSQSRKGNFDCCLSSVDCCPLSFGKTKMSVRKCKSRSNARFSLPYYIIKLFLLFTSNCIA